MSQAGILLGGLAVGTLFGLFGVGGSSFATPVLAMLGVPPLLAVASPLPAAVPSALTGSWAYLRRGEIDWRVVRLTILGALPMALLGSLASDYIRGEILLVASGVVLALAGLRIVRPIGEAAGGPAEVRRRSSALVLASAGLVGLCAGLLANGGGFLLIPLYLLVLGLPMRTSAGTSLTVISVLSIPTLLTHWTLGHIDWAVAALFAAGSVPAALAGAHLARRIDSDRLRAAFGWLLIGFAGFFLFGRLSG